MLATLNTLTTTLGATLSSIKPPRKALYPVIAAVLVSAGLLAWYRLVYLSAHAVAESVMQTATVRLGDLIISAAGSGSLTASEEQLGFSANGEMTVTGVYVKAGDLVEKGDLLAEVNSQQAQLDYENARQKVLDLTGTTAQAAAVRAMADAETQLQSAKLQLEYLISPDVMYWETEIDQAESALKKAVERAIEYPADVDAQKGVESAQAYLGFAQDQLADAQIKYRKEYVPETFPILVDGDTDTYAVPTEMELKQARLAIGDAQTSLKEAKELYAVLTGEPMPEQTDNESLIAIKQAKSNLEEAQARLDGTKIIAPFSGTVMEVNAAGGDTVAESPTDSDIVDASDIVLIADTSNPYLEVYWDESDWSLVKVGGTVEITFDDLPDQVFSGRITEVDSELTASNGTSAIRGEVSLDTSYSELNLPVGASASVTAISQRAADAIYIPVEALHDIGSGKYAVFVLVDGKPKVRTVEVGIQNDQYAQITSGLESGDVVTTGLVKTK